MAKHLPAKKLHYEISGHGPTVVLLHGFMASTRYWSEVTERLEREHRVVAIDLLGFGKSPKPTFSRYDYMAHMRSLERTINSLDLDDKFVLMGHSMGALMALRYTREHASQIKRLVLANMPIWANRREAKADVVGAHPIFKYVLNSVLHPVFWLIFRVAVKYKWLPASLSEDLIKRADYIFQSSAASRLRSLRNVIYAAKVQTDLAALTVKTTLLAGMNDRQAYSRNMRLLDLGANVRTQAVSGGHHLPLTAPSLVANLAR